MALLDDLQPASFRGVAFRVSTSRVSYGRRNAVHEYPLRDLPFAEDMGRRARTFRVRGFLIGDDALVQRRALIAACEAAGPGALIHPAHGEIEAVCNSVDIEDSEEGRIFRFVLDLTEAGSRAEPQFADDTEAAVLDLIDGGLDTLIEGIDAALDIAGLPEYVIGEAARVLNKAAGVISAIRPRSIVSGFASRLDGLLAILRDDGAEAIASGTAVATVFDALDALGSESEPRAIAERAGELVRLEKPATPEPMARSAIDVLHGAVQAAALVEIARAGAALEFASQTEAGAHRDRVRDLFDTGLDAAAARFDDVSWEFLSVLSAAVLTDVTARGASLAPLMPWRQPRPVPSVVAAWSLYRAPSRDGEIAAYLNARHPLFLPVEGLVLAR